MYVILCLIRECVWSESREREAVVGSQTEVYDPAIQDVTMQQWYCIVSFLLSIQQGVRVLRLRTLPRSSSLMTKLKDRL